MLWLLDYNGTIYQITKSELGHQKYHITKTKTQASKLHCAVIDDWDNDEYRVYYSDGNCDKMEIKSLLYTSDAEIYSHQRSNFRFDRIINRCDS